MKCAVCQFALDDYARAQSLLEEALAVAITSKKTLADYSQVAEILNNLGCLAYMCGESGAASGLFQQSLDVQAELQSQALYTSSAKLASQSASLNIAITRANIGYLKLAVNEAWTAIKAFEASLIVSDSYKSAVLVSNLASNKSSHFIAESAAGSSHGAWQRYIYNGSFSRCSCCRREQKTSNAGKCWTCE